MKHTYTYLTMMLAILGLVLFAACGNDDDKPAGDGDTDITDADETDTGDSDNGTESDDGDGDLTEDGDSTDSDPEPAQEEDAEADIPGEQDTVDPDPDDGDTAETPDAAENTEEADDTDTVETEQREEEQAEEEQAEEEQAELEAEENIEPGDAFEPDDNAAQAEHLGALPTDGTAQTHDFSDDPTDLIPIDCEAGAGVFIYVVPYLNETYEYIVDDQDNEIASFTHIDGQIEHNLTDRIFWTCDATARRYIKVSNGLGRVNDDDGYSIRVWSPVPADPCEQDDTRASACALPAIPDAPDELVQDDRNFFDDTEDWFGFAADAATVYTITVEAIDDNVRPGLAVYLGDSQTAADEEYNIGSTQTSVTITLPVTEATGVTARIVNTNDTFGVNTAYKLKLYKEAATATDYYELTDIDTFSNNDQLADAETVPLAASCHFRFTHRTGLYQDDWDCITFAAVAATPYRIEAADAVYGDTLAATKFRVYDDVTDGHYDGFLRGSSETGGDANTGPQTFTAAADTTYFVCFYSDISVPMDEWATYGFSITEAAR